MPNRLDPYAANRKVTHDPNVRMRTDPSAWLADNPVDSIDGILEAAVNSLLGEIDSVTGLDLLGIVTPLETLLGGSTGLLSGLLGWLTPGSGTTGTNVFSTLLGDMGLGSLGGLSSFLMPTSLLGSAAGVLAPLLSGGSLLGALIPGLDASKITSGTFSLSMIAGLLTSGTITTSLLSVPLSVIIGLLSGGSILGSLIPGLDASKITTGTFGLGFIPNLPASQITSGTFGTGLIPNLPASIINSGSFLASLIPSLDASKITTGTFGSALVQPVIDAVSQGFGGSTGLSFAALQSFLGGLSFGGISFDDLIGLFPHTTGGLSGSTGLTSILTDLFGMLGSPTALGSGTPVLPGVGSIPVLGGLLSGGSILGSLIPGLDASKITTGTFGTGLIPNLSAAILTSGTLLSSLIPSLDASKITTGTFGAGFIPNITKAMSTDLQGVIDAAYQATNGGSSTGNTVASVKTGLLNFPGANIASSLLAAVIPSLDASKITTGAFGTGQIPNLPASIITSGTFGTGLIPNLAASIINSGTFAGSLIPNLDASKITTGTFSQSMVTGLTALLAAFPAANLTGTITETVTGLGTLRDAFVNGLGLIGSAFTNTQAQNQATAVQQTASAALASAQATAAQQAAQQAQSNANNAIGGVYYNITQNGADGAALSADFGSTGPTSGDLCIRGSVNEIGIKAANGDGVYWAVCAASRIFTTENQSIALTLGSQGGSTQAPQIGYMHCDSGFTAGTYVREDNGSVTLGSFTRSGSTFTYTPFSGGTWSGALQSANRVQVFNVGTSYSIVVGNTVVKTVTGSHTAGRFYWAISMDRKTTSSGWFFGSTTYDAFRVAGVSVSDYVQPTYPGSSARMYRTTTTGVTLSSSAAGTLLAGSFFNVADTSTNSPDITVDLANGKFTVTKSGRYICVIRFKFNTSTTGGAARVAPVLFYQGAVNQRGNEYSYADGSGILITGGVQGTFIIPMAANETVQAGYAASAASAVLLGEATGLQCYFSIAKIG